MYRRPGFQGWTFQQGQFPAPSSVVDVERANLQLEVSALREVNADLRSKHGRRVKERRERLLQYACDFISRVAPHAVVATSWGDAAVEAAAKFERYIETGKRP